MTKKFLLAALVASIFTANNNNGFAEQNNNPNTKQDSLVTIDEQIATEEENNETISTPVKVAIGAVATAAVISVTYFGLKKFAGIDLYSKLSEWFSKKTPKVENNNTVEQAPEVKQAPKVEQAPEVEQTPKIENKAPKIWFSLFGHSWQHRYVRDTAWSIYTSIKDKLSKTASKVADKKA